MIKAKSDDRMFGKVAQFVHTTPLPGGIVSKTGEITFLNERMMALANLGQSNHVYKCSRLAEEDSGSRPDCAEAPVVEGKCFVSRENSAVTLLAAEKVMKPKTPLAAFIPTAALCD